MPRRGGAVPRSIAARALMRLDRNAVSTWPKAGRLKVQNCEHPAALPADRAASQPRCTGAGNEERVPERVGRGSGAVPGLVLVRVGDRSVVHEAQPVSRTRADTGRHHRRDSGAELVRPALSGERRPVPPARAAVGVGAAELTPGHPAGIGPCLAGILPAAPGDQRQVELQVLGGVDRCPGPRLLVGVEPVLAPARRPEVLRKRGRLWCRRLAAASHRRARSRRSRPGEPYACG